MGLFQWLFGKAQTMPPVTLNPGDKVYIKNDDGNPRVIKTLNPAARRHAKRMYVLQNWELMTAAVKEHKADTRFRMSFPAGSKRKAAVNGLKMILQYAPSSVDYDIFNTLKNLHKEACDYFEVRTNNGLWRPKHITFRGNAN